MASSKHDSPLPPDTLDAEYGLTVEELRQNMDLGVTPDNLNYRQLFGLFFGGIFLVLVLILFAMELYRYWDFKTGMAAAVAAEYPDLQRLRAADAQTLGTFGVVDAEQGIYRIPVDSAITLMVDEATR